MHVAQLLSDLMTWSHRQQTELWLASFDVQKCFDSLPWWAVFGIMRHTGISPLVVRCYQSFYAQLRRRFRYGQVDGSCWSATNGLAQGCPASPDFLNLLFEPFHRWAAASGFGCSVGSYHVVSTSFADDLALIASSQSDIEALIAAYLRWCSLLGLHVTKVQVWCNHDRPCQVQVGSSLVETSPTFKIVGVVLGSDEKSASEQHFNPRLAKASSTAQRLRLLDLPASLCSLLWRTTVLPQALYGCELRVPPKSQLSSLTSAGKSIVPSRKPLSLNSWRAPEVVMGPPLGDCALLDPALEMRHRQLRWALVLANSPGLVGTIHRSVAFHGGNWVEPSLSLRQALKDVGWTLRRNLFSHLATNWPDLHPLGWSSLLFASRAGGITGVRECTRALFWRGSMKIPAPAGVWHFSTTPEKGSP